MFDNLDDPNPPDFDAGRLHAVTTEGSLRRRRHRRRRLAGSVAGGIAVVLAVVGFVGYEGNRLGSVEKAHVATQPASEEGVTTILFVGSDRGIGVGPARADAIALVRLAHSKATVLRIPRDLAVHTPGGQSRLANVLQDGGPAALVDALGDNLGIGVQHFVQVDPDGMARLIDLVGGVRVRTAEALRDGWMAGVPTWGTGITLPAGTCTTLDGDRALALARSRHLEVDQDGSWVADHSGDLGRMARQNELAVALLASFHRLDVASPVEMDRLVDAFVHHATVDSGLDTASLVALARDLHGLSSDAIISVDLPVTPGQITRGSTKIPVLVTAPGWKRVVDDFENGTLDGTGDGHDGDAVPGSVPGSGPVASISSCR